MLVDGDEGPKRSTPRIARHKYDSRYPPTLIQETNNIMTEVISTRIDRDTNFVHLGWSLSATSTGSPWISSRIASNNQVLQTSDWVTKRTIVQRIAIDIDPQDLEPTPEFETDVRIALGKSNRFECFQALDQVFRLWWANFFLPSSDKQIFNIRVG